jgi:hypothetical protein
MAGPGTNLGSAYVTVNAVTKDFGKQVSRGLRAAGGDGDRAGRKVGISFAKSFGKSFGSSRSIFGPSFFVSATAARKQFQRLVRLGFTLGPIITFLIAVIGALANGLFVVAAAVGAASPALIVFVAGLVALGQAAVVASIALKGVAEALGAGFKAATGGGAKSTKDLTSQLDRVEDARRRLARVTESAAERIADANEKVIEAEQDYIDAQIESRKAAQDLAKAREEAAEDLQQLRFETEDAAISEQKARLEFERSRESLQRVQDLPPNSRARREAELAFAEADLNLRRSIDRNADLKKSEAAATAAGVDGSEKVQDASEKLNKAKEREAKAFQDIAKAQQDAAKVQRDALRDIEDAQRDVERALRDLNKAQNDNTGAANTYKEALSKLSPEAQSFVKLIVANRDAFIALRDAAGRQLFPGLERAFLTILPRFKDLEKLLEGTGKSLGKVAEEFADTIVEGENFSRLERVWKTNDELIVNFGDAASNLYEILLILLDAAEPLIKEFGEWTKTVTEGWRETLKAKDATGELRENFITAGKFAKDIIGIIKDLSIGLFNIGKAALGPDGGGTLLIKAMKDATGEFRDFTGSVEGQNSIKQYFIDAEPNIRAVSRFIGNIGVSIGKLGNAPGVDTLSDKLSEALSVWDEIGATLLSDDIATSLGDVAINLSELIKAFTDSGSITIFFETLNAVLVPIKEFFQSDFGQQIIGTIGPILAVLNAIALVGSIAIFYFKVVVGSIGAIFTVATTLSNIFFGKQNTQLAIFYIKYYAYEAKLWVTKNLKAAAYWVYENLKSALFYVARGIQSAAFWVYENLKSAAYWVAENLKNAAYWVSKTAKSAAYWVIENGKLAAYWVAAKAKSAAFFAFSTAKAIIFNATMLLNPIFLIVAVIIAIGIGFVTLYKKWEPFRNAVNKVLDTFKDIWQKVKDIVAALKDSALGKAVSRVLGGGGEAGAVAAAEGGIVRPSRYGTLAVIGEAGRSERIEPLDPDGLSVRDRAIIRELSGGGGGATINVYPSPGMDEQELAEMVSRKLSYQIRRGGM